MTREEQQKMLMQTVRILNDNGGNRITEALINGISITLRQASDSMVVADPPAAADNVGSDAIRKE